MENSLVIGDKVEQNEDAEVVEDETYTEIAMDDINLFPAGQI